ncbi:MAG: hypothetical protein SF066_14085, partial [Thermoanaerobaculia bacterium]|nr:hypothetical protein [Thermoanaerobaculia bacterium]
MTKKLIVCLSLVALLALGGQAFAEICSQDNVPAASLLLPYFEVDLDNAGGVTTLFSINNASANSVLAHVTLWSDESVPTLDFDIYLSGYDVQTINIRDIFNGTLPRTAATNSVSNRGALSGPHIAFPGCAASLPYTNPALSSVLLTHIREAHTGGLSPVYGRCAGFDFGDNIARGYITVDSVNACNLEFPSAPGYFIAGGQGIANNNNVLWGDYFYVNSEENFAQGETLVHLEACDNPSVGQGGDDCPFIAGDYTFYGRYVAASAADGREPLSTMFATRYLNGGAFDGGTDLIVWRDSKTVANTGHSCSGEASWFP